MNCPSDFVKRCRSCDYPLEGLTDNQCPECGQAFDPQDPESYTSRFSERVLRHCVWTWGFLVAWLLVVGLPAASAALLAASNWIVGQHYLVAPGLFASPKSPLLWAIARPVLVVTAVPVVAMLVITRVRWVRIRERRRREAMRSRS